jgi:hypothetical protein
MEDAPFRRIAQAHSHIERLDRQILVHTVAGGPAYEAAPVQIEDYRKVEPTLGGSDIANIASPFAVGRIGCEVAIQHPDDALRNQSNTVSPLPEPPLLGAGAESSATQLQDNDCANRSLDRVLECTQAIGLRGGGHLRQSSPAKEQVAAQIQPNPGIPDQTIPINLGCCLTPQITGQAAHAVIINR